MLELIIPLPTPATAVPFTTGLSMPASGSENSVGGWSRPVDLSCSRSGHKKSVEF